MDKLVLTADQIYALAYIMKAEYLDFYYITASTRDDNTNWLFDVTNQLVSLEILDEDFSGNTTIKPEVEELVKPLYFGKKESSLDIDIFGEKESNNAYRFHFLDDKITMAKKVNNGYEFSEVKTDDIRNLVSSILPKDYEAESKKAYIKYDENVVSRVFVAKNTELDVKNLIATFVETDGVVYEENESNEIFSLSGEDFNEKLYSIMAEV
ncbi:MAG: hypothetical protein J6Y58_11210 [Clostridiales bacterium]|nr:hypothetical protein [Clostridiales bacterium]